MGVYSTRWHFKLNILPKKFTLIILSSNKLYGLKNCIDGYKKINNRYFEKILVDDGSVDGSLEFAKSCEFFDQIISLPPPSAKRCNTLRNMGINASTNDYILLIDCDTIPYSTIFDGHEIVLSMGDHILSAGGRTHHFPYTLRFFKNDERKELTGNYFTKLSWFQCYGCNMAFSKKIWEKIEGFDEDFNGAWGFDDIDFAFRAESIGAQIWSHHLSSCIHLCHKCSIDHDINAKKFQQKIKKYHID